MTFDYFKPVGVACLVLALAAAGGCVQLGLKEDLPPEEKVRIRAQAWLDALLTHDLHGAYELTSPNYRKFADAGRYNARVQGTSVWDRGEIDTVVCEEASCTVRIIVEYRAERMKVDIRRPREYKWVESEGEWWLYVPPS